RLETRNLRMLNTPEEKSAWVLEAGGGSHVGRQRKSRRVAPAATGEEAKPLPPRAAVCGVAWCTCGQRVRRKLRGARDVQTAGWWGRPVLRTSPAAGRQPFRSPE